MPLRRNKGFIPPCYGPETIPLAGHIIFSVQLVCQDILWLLKLPGPSSFYHVLIV